MGPPPGPLSRPTIVCARPYALVSRSLLLPFQPTVSVACEEATVPFGGPGATGPPDAGRFAIVIIRSSTGAALPAASITLTTRWWGPSLALVVSKPTSALTDPRHG